MPPDSRGIWTPRSTTRFFPRRAPAFTATPYTPPKEPRKKMTIEQAMTHEGAEMLGNMAKHWLEEAARLEASTRDPTFEEEVGDVLLTRQIRIPDLLKQWDTDCGGTVTKGEFRLNLKKFMENAGKDTAGKVFVIDALFDQFDEDRSGTMDLHELQACFLRMQTIAQETRKKIIEPRERAARLRVRAAAAHEAHEAVAHAENLEAELEAAQEALDNSLDVQLGIVLHKRKIRVGDVVGEWAKSRRAELTKAEFRDNVRQLLPTNGAGGSPARMLANQQIDALFDSIDTDKSGYLDLKEAKVALKGLQQQAFDKIKNKEAKAAQAARVRRKASKKSAAALGHHDHSKPSESLDGSPPMPLPPPSPESPTTDGSPSRRNYIASIFTSPKKFFEDSEEQRTEKERKAEAAARAQNALRLMNNRSLAAGWQAWRAYAEHRAWQMAQIKQGVAVIMHFEAWRGWATWKAHYKERNRILHILHGTMHRLAMSDAFRGWASWRAFCDDQAERRRLETLATSTRARLKGPRYLAMYDFWHEEQRLAAVARGDLHLAGFSWQQRLCAALTKCT